MASAKSLVRWNRSRRAGGTLDAPRRDTRAPRWPYDHVLAIAFASASAVLTAAARAVLGLELSPLALGTWAVAITSLVAGFAPSVTAGITAAIAATFVLRTPDGDVSEVSPAGQLRIGLFLLASVGLSAVGELARHARDLAGAARAREAEREARAARNALARSEERLGVAETRLRLAVSASGIGYWYWDIDTDRVEQDANCADLFGGKPGELATLGAFRRRVHLEDWDALERRIWEAAKGTPFDAEFRVVLPDGEVRWLAARGDVVRDASGRPCALAGLNVDVTKAKRAEAALRHREGELRHIVDDAPLILWITDARGGCLYLTRRWHELTGQTESEALGGGWLDAVHPDDRDRVAAVSRRAHAREESLVQEYRLRHRDGLYRHVLDAGVPRRRGEAFSGLIGYVIDITDRKATEDALRASEERLRLAQSETGLGTWDWDIANNEAVCSDEWYALHGLSSPPGAAFTQETLLGAIHPEDRAHMEGLVAAAITGRVSRPEAEYRVRMPDGRTRWLASRARIHFGPDGRPERMLGITLDVTERKKVATEVSQMKHADAVKRLAGGVAHEVNNQMTAVLGLSEFVLGRSDLPKVVRDDVEEIRNAAERSARIAEQMLAFSRQQVLAPTTDDLNALVREAEPILRSLLGPDIALTLSLDDGPLRVHVDSFQMQRVLAELAENARDAMPRGGALAIATRCVPAHEALEATKDVPGDLDRQEVGDAGAGRYACMTVTDTGHGMSEDTLTRVFDPFFTTKSVGKNVGLGLPTLFGIVRQHGGNVTVDSAPGRGATFRLYFPLVEDGETALRAPRVEQPATVGTVLVVDDDASVRRIAVRVLEDAGFTILEASNGREALDVLERAADRVDIVLTDLVMPEMDGRELIRILGDRRPGLPVVSMSGYAAAASIGPRGEEGAAGFLAKPFSPRQLVAKIREVLDARARDAAK